MDSNTRSGFLDAHAREPRQCLSSAIVVVMCDTSVPLGKRVYIKGTTEEWMPDCKYEAAQAHSTLCKYEQYAIALKALDFESETRECLRCRDSRVFSLLQKTSYSRCAKVHRNYHLAGGKPSIPARLSLKSAKCSISFVPKSTSIHMSSQYLFSAY